MCVFDSRNDSRFIDPCFKNIIQYLQKQGIKTLASCCGHRKYYPTIVVQDGSEILEIFSGKIIPRKKKFYKKDDYGVYFIPETIA